MEHTFYRRLLSAVCAIALAFTAVCPAVAAAPEDTTGTPQTLTVSEVQEMQQTDAAVTALTDSAAYAGMSEEERQAAALAQLDVLAAQGLVEKNSIYVDAENGMVSFAYRCGALGGILLTDTESEADRSWRMRPPFSPPRTAPWAMRSSTMPLITGSTATATPTILI